MTTKLALLYFLTGIFLSTVDELNQNQSLSMIDKISYSHGYGKCVVILPGKSLFIVGGGGIQGGTICVGNLGEKNTGKFLNVAKEIILCVESCPENEQILCCGYSGVQFFNYMNGKVAARIHDFKSASSCRYNQKRTHFAIGGWEKIIIYESKTKKKLGILDGHTDCYVDTIDFSPDGELLVSGGGPEILIWDWKKGRVIQRTQVCQKDVRVTNVRFSREKDTILYSTVDGMIGTFNISSNIVKSKATGLDSIFSMSIIAKDNQLVVGGLKEDIPLDRIDGIIQRWDLATMKLKGKEIVHQDSFPAFAMSDDGKIAVTTGKGLNHENVVVPLIKTWRILRK